MSLRSPLGRARGLGSSRSGLDTYWMQRLTAVTLVPLVLWFVISLIILTGADYDAAKAWVAKPFNAALLLLTLFAGLWHAALGLQVVVEDYVHAPLTKHLGLIAIRAVAAFLAISVALSTLKLALGG